MAECRRIVHTKANAKRPGISPGLLFFSCWSAKRRFYVGEPDADRQLVRPALHSLPVGRLVDRDRCLSLEVSCDRPLRVDPPRHSGQVQMYVHFFSFISVCCDPASGRIIGSIVVSALVSSLDLRFQTESTCPGGNSVCNHHSRSIEPDAKVTIFVIIRLLARAQQGLPGE